MVALNSFRVWNLLNLETGEALQGQFHGENLTEEIGNTFSDTFSLGKQFAVTQYTHGNIDTFSFLSRFVADRATSDITDKLNLLKSFARRNPIFGRPPICQFWVSDGSFAFLEGCFIESLSGIRYERPTFFGGLRIVSFTVNLREFKAFELESEVFETRFHNVKEKEYYELLTQKEYGNALIGDVIRKRNPDKANIQTGDIIKLPRIEAIRKETVTQTSIPLITAFGKPLTPEKDLRMDIFDRRDDSFVSHIISEPI